MKYLGTWLFHSIGTLGDDGIEYLSAEEYLKAPMPYIDETDADAVADEIKERKMMIATQIEFCENGDLYMLMPIPEGATKEEIDEAVSKGMIKLYNGRLLQSELKWEERDGEIWYDTGIEGEIMGEAADTWAKAISDEGFFEFMNIRFAKADD